MKQIKSYVSAWLKSWWKKKIRCEFAKTIPHGRVEVCWVDVDGMVYGWHMSADEEFDLVKVAQMMSLAKAKKTFDILNSKGVKSYGKQSKKAS